MRQRNGGNIQGEQTMEEIFARISLQLASFHSILQEMKPSRRRVITCPEATSPVIVGVGRGFPACPERDVKSEWLFAVGDA